MRNITILLAIWVMLAVVAKGQKPDTVANQYLREVSIHVLREDIDALPQIDNGFLWSGKKSEVIRVQNLDANIAEKTPRQIFAKVPGVFVYDMDGSGNQTNISTRGLDPHRGWEFNIRTNGIINNSDIYGYPASHFSLPMEAIGRIELVRGTGALQYGAQFGGMLNYVLKQPDTTRAISLESINSLGSYGLFSAYNAVGGKVGKLQYYAYFSKRVSAGYRENSHSNYNGQGMVLTYRISPSCSLNAELLRSEYTYQIPGPLTDAMFQENPRQATRSRNYFNPEIWIPSLTTKWEITPNTQLRWTVSAVLGARRSVMYDRLATVGDTINTQTNHYNTRVVDLDGFNSYTSELRLLQKYSLLGHSSFFTLGVQYFNNDLHRRQQGKGTTGADFDLSIYPNTWGRDLHLKSRNIAFSLENKFQLSDRISISPGIRYESGISRLSGITSYASALDITNSIEHQYPLMGVNAAYAVRPSQTMYAGCSQAYRPVIFKDIIPATAYERSDKNLRDAFGYNAELGWRGKSSHIRWDVSAFTLRYNNRLGSLAQYDTALDTFILYKTNIGDARTHGLELFAEYECRFSNTFNTSIFTSTAYFHARYLGDSLRINSKENRSISGNHLESVPGWISRNGVNFTLKNISISFLYSYTGSTFSDPLNTVLPSVSGATGKVPAYGLLDVNATYRIRNIVCRIGLNNATNRQYFTKRPTFYPGPGVWPSDGRSLVCSVAIRV